jgi:hypothetical protein
MTVTTAAMLSVSSSRVMAKGTVEFGSSQEMPLACAASE